MELLLHSIQLDWPVLLPILICSILTVMDQYITQTRRAIKGNWYPPVTSFENSATIVITLDRKGNLIKCHLSEPSPSEEFNNSLIDAAKKVKYAPLPYDFPYNTVDLDFQFGMQRRNISK